MEEYKADLHVHAEQYAEPNHIYIIAFSIGIKTGRVTIIMLFHPGNNPK